MKIGLREVFPAILLMYSSWTDIRRREISGRALMIFGVVGLLFTYIGIQLEGFLFCTGILLGLFLMVLSVLTQGELGMGDGLLVLVIGLFLGGEKTLAVLLTGMLLAALFSMTMLVARGFMRRHPFPFVPFLLGGFALNLGLSYFV